MWGPPGAENPSFNTFDASLTSIYSFADDLGYQGSQELTSVSASHPAGPSPGVPRPLPHHYVDTFPH